MNDVQLQLLNTPEVRQFIIANEYIDEKKLILKSPSLFGLPAAVIANQIAGRRKAKDKLPAYYEKTDVIYPRSLNIEQCSSQTTAIFKAHTLAGNTKTHRSMIDLSGGFGVDSFFFSRVFDKLIYVEPDPELAFIARHNHERLQAKNIDHFTSTAEVFLAHHPTPVDAVYIDPSRRLENRKVFRLSDCTPDVTNLQGQIFTITDVLLIKASPMLDLTAAIRDLEGVAAVIVVSVDYECRELLLLCKNGFPGEPTVMAVHIHGQSSDVFDFAPEDEKSADIDLGPPQKYLYEPNPSILKAGAFKLVARRFGLTKLHSNTHLYTGAVRVDGFPGRTFEVLSEVKSSATEARKLIPDLKANILVRNYPLSPDELRKKLRLGDGGETFLIATTSIEGRGLWLTRRV